MAQPAEASGHAATASASMDNNVLAIVIAATVSTSVFIVAILILLLLLYHRDPMCCQFLCSCRLFQTPSQYEHPPSYFSSSQQLVAPQRGASRLESTAENPGMQMPPPYEHALRHPPAFSGTGISSETLDRLSVPHPFHAPLSYQTQRNTVV
ncbi:uncharacterized protein [Taeniopygia guttata]|uniref:uncharacterized protein isoform X2 n=1 Tax=Taeniopygia guttata TaxID=59729 RepID=UPI0011AF2B68|nr:uncharacterized protein LOC115497694 isoform X2 [Taeniopygia guttata]